MATMRELKERIDSLHSSRKITGAMKMISSARLRKAEARLLQAAPYRKQLWELYAHIKKNGCDYRSPLSREGKVQKIALIVYASDDGLCGAFNINLYKRLAEVVQKYKVSGIQDITVIPIGRKIQHDVDSMKGVRVEHQAGFERKNNLNGTHSLTDELIDRFQNGSYDRVEVIYAHYKSIGTQIVMVRQFLPVTTIETEKSPSSGIESWYIYEPDSETALKMLYPLMLRALMYEICMENNTSEQAARVLAMQMANDNAAKLLDNLHLEYNQLRQQSITSELLDIAGGGTPKD